MPFQNYFRLSRREVLAALATSPLLAQSSQLPLKTSGLEHVGFTSPDPLKSASFYGRIFDPQIFQEKDPPYRYYARLGAGYVAFGPSPSGPGRIDHFCALVENYRIEDMRKELDAKGIKLVGQPGFNAVTDSDGLRMQLIETPAGLAKTIIPSTRVTQDDAAVHAIGLDHVMLAVSDLEKAAAFYRIFFGAETRTKNPDRVWFTAAKTRLGLQLVRSGQKPEVDHFSIRVAAYDRKRITERLGKLQVEMAPETDEKLLRFKDSDGIFVELRPGV